MADRNTVKPRTCQKCGDTAARTAAQIKTHASTCKATRDV